MVSSILIVAVSMALFLYWFRYTCVLILKTRTTRDYSSQVATANQMSFVTVRDKLGELQDVNLDAFHASLERDYRLVSSLLKQAGHLEVGGTPLEELMVRADFRLMQVAYSVARRLSEAKSRAALEEMSQVVAHMANTFGERAASSAKA